MSDLTPIGAKGVLRIDLSLSSCLNVRPDPDWNLTPIGTPALHGRRGQHEWVGYRTVEETAGFDGRHTDQGVSPQAPGLYRCLRDVLVAAGSGSLADS